MKAPQIVKLSLTELFPCPENRPDRSGFDEKSIAELAASFLPQGVLEPLLVRPLTNGKTGKGYEIVCGERRWTAASLIGVSKEVTKQLGLAKLADLPCIITDLSDTEAREVRLIENLQRKDIHPIEEAKSYRTLLDEVEEVPTDTRGASAAVPKKRYTIETLAKKLGKSPTFLYARLKLLKMPRFAQDAMFNGKLNASVALLLCRIPDPKLAHKAALEVLDTGYCSGETTDEQREQRALDKEIDPMSYRQAKTHIQNKYMIRLKGAPFDQESADLVPVALVEGERRCGGKCSDCPMRTGNMKDLFPDVDSADVCTNPTCFASKKKAAFKAEAERFKGKGQTLLTDNKAKGLLDYEGKELNSQARAQFIDLRANLPGKRNKTYEDVLSEHLPADAEVFVARGKKNHLLVPIDTAIAAAKAAGVKIEKPKADPNDNWNDPAARQKREEQQQRQVAISLKVQSEASVLLGVNLGKAKIEHVLRFLAESACQDWCFRHRHGLEGDAGVEKFVAKLNTVPLLLETMVEANIGEVVQHTGELSENFIETCKHFEVPIDKLIAKHTEAAKAQKPDADKPAAKPDKADKADPAKK